VEEVARYQAAINKTMKYNKRVVDETAKLYELETEEVRPRQCKRGRAPQTRPH